MFSKHKLIQDRQLNYLFSMIILPQIMQVYEGVQIRDPIRVLGRILRSYLVLVLFYIL